MDKARLYRARQVSSTSAPAARRRAQIVEHICLFAVFACLWATGLPADADGDPATNGSAPRLGIVEQYNLPMKEISGLALEHSGPDGISLYAVGDATFNIGRFTHDRTAAAVAIAIRDVANTIRAKTGAPSQWEAVAADGASNICILAEKSSRVVCLNSTVRQEIGRLRIEVDNDAHLAKQWKTEPNSRGEGMILMRRGHVLVVKEKRPSLIIEFGPKGDAANGWDAHALLAAGEPFALPASRKLVSLKTWEFAANLAAIAPDASELTVGPDNRLYMLSQEGAKLIRLERSLGPNEDKVHASAWWRLPEQFDHAEGLVIDDELHPWVAVDIHRTDQPNLFRLTPLEAP